MKENKKYRFRERRKYKISQVLLLAIIIISCLSLITILARYVVNQVNNFFLRSKEFYFYSDKLDEDKAFYQIDNWSGVDDYTIVINMDSTENNLKSTGYDISYDITYECSSNIICQLSKTSGIIYSNVKSDYFNLVITPNANLTQGDKVSVTIRAKSTTNYQKELSAEFVLIVGKEDLSYEIVDSVNNPYMELNITNRLSYYTVAQSFLGYAVGDKISRDEYLNLTDEDKKKCHSTLVTAKFDPQTIILDMTNTNYLNATNIVTTTINGQEYIDEITFKVDAISSTKVRFYKKDISKDYTYPVVNPQSIVTLTNI